MPILHHVWTGYDYGSTDRRYRYLTTSLFRSTVRRRCWSLQVCGLRRQIRTQIVVSSGSEQIGRCLLDCPSHTVRFRRTTRTDIDSPRRLITWRRVFVNYRIEADSGTSNSTIGNPRSKHQERRFLPIACNVESIISFSTKTHFLNPQFAQRQRVLEPSINAGQSTVFRFHQPAWSRPWVLYHMRKVGFLCGRFVRVN